MDEWLYIVCSGNLNSSYKSYVVQLIVRKIGFLRKLRIAEMVNSEFGIIDGKY